jgi:hypothetical protein
MSDIESDIEIVASVRKAEGGAPFACLHKALADVPGAGHG